MKNSIGCSRRQFIGGALAAGAALRAQAAENKLAFVAAEKEFHFDTGALRGTLRDKGRSVGLIPAFDCASGTALTRSMGLFSHYRLLDDTTRYGHGAWDWVSEAKLLDDGAVEARWSADDAHPFEMMATYRWTAPNALDLTTRVTARKALRRFEGFLASYFEGFPETTVYAKEGFVGVPKSAGVWHMFPRDEEAVKTIQDGRWKHPPSPVEWTIRPALAAPLAVRRDATSGLAAVLMTQAADCFAVATPHDGEGHRSVYFSLFGRDLKSGESATAHSRLVIAREVTDAKAVSMYESFARQKN